MLTNNQITNNNLQKKLMRKFTLLMMSLLLTVGAMAQGSWCFNTKTEPTLPGTNENGQYSWTSSVITPNGDFSKIRLTFVQNINNGIDAHGYPHVAIAEFYLYDKEGNRVTLTETNLSSNATETEEGSIGELIDGETTQQDGEGQYDWYWHSFWSSSPDDFHYLQIDLTGIEADLSEFKIGFVTRQHNASPTEIIISTGNDDTDVQCEKVEITYNHKLNGDTKLTEVLKTVKGASYPNANFPWGVSAEIPTGNVDDAETVDLICSFNNELPFEPASSYNDITNWYYLQFTANKYNVRYNESDTYIPLGNYEKTSVDFDAYIWAFVGNPYDGYKLYNRKSGAEKILSSTRNVYDGNTGANTYPIMVAENTINEATHNKTWTISKSNAISGENGIFIGLSTTQNAIVNMNNRGSKIAFWTGGQGDGSTFILSECKEFDLFDLAKNEALATLAELEGIPALFSTEKINSTKDNINNIACAETSSKEDVERAVSLISSEINSLTAGVHFTLKNLSDNTKYLTTSSGYAAVTETNDIYAYWTLKNVNGYFYIYNHYNNAYLKAIPSTNETKIQTTSDISTAALYKIKKIEENNKIALTSFLKANVNEGVFLHKAGDGRIVRWNAQSTTTASLWLVEKVDYASQFSALIDNVIAAKTFKDTPGLGEYPTTAKTAFDEVLNAYEENANEENELALLDAITILESKKNRPVYVIENMKDYAVGKAIYEITSSELKFKTTNVYDKTMLWALDQTTTDVATTEKVVLTNYASKNGFWGSNFISIIETEPADEDDEIFMFKTNGTGSPVHAQQSGSQIVRWSSADANTVGGASTWKFIYVANTYDLDQLADSYYENGNALFTAYHNSQNYNAHFGTGLGQYSNGEILTTAQSDANTIISETRYGANEEQINTAKNNIASAIEALKINLPVAGKYYTFNQGNSYITSNVANDKIACGAKGASAIYYFDGEHLLAYTTGLYFGLDATDWTFEAVGSTDISKIEFIAAANKAIGKYNIKSADRWLHLSSNNGSTYINRCQNNTCGDDHNWTIEEVTSLPVTITAAKYATFYAPVAVTVPEGVTAHTVTVNGEWATLSEALEVIPANTGVVLYSETAGTYNFAVTTADAFEGENLMAGTIAKTLVTKPDNTECYVLAKPEGAEVAAMYIAVNGEDATKFYNAGHKAYLEVAGSSNVSFYGFRFGGEDDETTGVEKVETVTENAVIFDLAGRRVSEITAPGIYIVNGKKVLVK